MSPEKSPSLKDFESILPDTSPSPRKPSGSQLLWAGLITVTLLLLIANFIQSSNGSRALLLPGSAAVRGIVLTHSGRPPAGGYVMLLQTRQTSPLAADGSFELKNLPEGKQTLVILDQYTGYEIPIILQAGETLDVGNLRFTTTAEPAP
jgi:hypothetical protein